MIALYNFAYGTMLIEYEGEVLYKLRCTPDKNIYKSGGIHSSFTDEVIKQTEEYFLGKRKTFDVKYELTGTSFQLKVWRELQKIPYGHTATYKQIAAATGNAAACRAVGMGNNKNPLMIIIPCHRVVGAKGSLTGYAGGLEMKKALLNTEKTYMNN